MKKKSVLNLNITNSDESKKQFKRIVPAGQSCGDLDRMPRESRLAAFPRVITTILPEVSASSVQDPSTANVIAAKLDGERPIRRFAVVYSRSSTRKHKIWENDGMLVIQGNTIFLKDVDDGLKNVASSYNNNITELEALTEGRRLHVGQFEVEIQNEVYDPEAAKIAALSNYDSLQALMYAKAEELVTLDDDED